MGRNACEVERQSIADDASVTSDVVRHPRLLLFPCHCSPGLLATQMAQAEHPFACGQLLFLWLVGLEISQPHLDLHNRRLLLRQVDLAQATGRLIARCLLSISVVLNLSFLGFFKYYDFFAASLSDSLALLGINAPVAVLGIILPPGISFYTFQELAYLVDVYNRKLEPSKSLVDYALFISLFPHLIAGPIQRPSHLLPQVQHPRTLDSSRFFDGIMLILSGLFRKAVVADNCALLANAAFSGKLGEPNLAVVLIGAYAFAWQIYGDFSGYSDMARGSAQLLGFHFMVNFRQPYLSRSIQEFWRRWHISLSTWLRDYLYIGLGGNRHGEAKTYRNLLTTMVLGGLWHGANVDVRSLGSYPRWLARRRTRHPQLIRTTGTGHR